jgi:hypothetical protein
MLQKRYNFLCLLLVAVSFAGAQGKGTFEPIKVELGEEQRVQKIGMSGPWLFLQDESANRSSEAIDKAAERIEQKLSSGIQDWYTVEVPQFLNQIRWWLPTVSPEHERQEAERVKSFPFDVEGTQAGWYLHKIKLPAISGDKPNLYVSFEGIAMISRVYCNGHYVGGHVGMFGEFDCYLTPYLKLGWENNLLVYVERGVQSKDASEVVGIAVTVPVTRDMLTSLNCGVFGGCGRGPRAKFMGIWQPVSLKISQPGGRIEDVFFIPSLDGHELKISLENPREKSVTGRIRYFVRDVQSREILYEETVSDIIFIGSGQTAKVSLEKKDLVPKLWTPDRPNLYELEVQWISENGNIVDSWLHKVGYRTVEVRGKYVYLNGKPYWSRGANMPPFGYKPNSMIFARAFLQKMKQGNTVVTRSHCNPFSQMEFTLCDEIGIGVSCEGVRPWALMSKEPPPPKAILEHWKQEQLEITKQYRNEQLEITKQYRNHPSIMFYCISNEGLQGDHENPEKLAIFKDIIESVRQMDSTRPIFQTSGDPDPWNVADIEDIHAYWGWYEPSSFVNDYSKPMRGLGLNAARKGKAFINQELGMPYQNTDTGGVLPLYFGLYSAHPWVGELGVHGDPKYFSEHTKMVAKLVAEKLRYQRKDCPTSGVMIFGNMTWIQHALSKPPQEWKPFPVWYGVKDAFEPVMVALETTQYVFYPGRKIKTNVYIVNDDIEFQPHNDCRLNLQILDDSGNVKQSEDFVLGSVDYFAVEKFPIEFTLPQSPKASAARIAYTVRLNLFDGNEKISQNNYSIQVAPDEWTFNTDRNLLVLTEGCRKGVTDILKKTSMRVLPLDKSETIAGRADVVLLGSDAKVDSLPRAIAALKKEGRVILLEQGRNAASFCPEIITDKVEWSKSQHYKIVKNGLKEGAKWATDRQYSFRKIPAHLKGKDYIMIRMDDKMSDPEKPLMKFILSEGSKLIVGFDDRCTELPNWLSKFKETGKSISTTTNCGLKLYEKWSRGGSVILYGSRAAGAAAMYSVIIDSPGKAIGLQVAGIIKGQPDNVTGEFVEMLGWKEGTAVFDGLEAMDWKWWCRGDGSKPAYVCSFVHNIDLDNDSIKPIGRYLATHFYWGGDYQQTYLSKLRYPVFAVKRDWGSLIVCELDISDAVEYDPRAGKTLVNLIKKKI